MEIKQDLRHGSVFAIFLFSLLDTGVSVHVPVLEDTVAKFNTSSLCILKFSEAAGQLSGSDRCYFQGYH